MSLPLPVSSSATPQGPPTLRSSVPAKSSVASPPARTHGAVRPGGAPSTRIAKGKSGFASVLDAVQRDDRESTVPTARPAAVERGPVAQSDNETELPRRGLDTATPRPAGPLVDAAPATAQASPQTPWLLLALGIGAHTWQEPGMTEGEFEGEVAPLAVDVVAASSSAVIPPLQIEANAPALPVGPSVLTVVEAMTPATRAGTVPAGGDVSPAPVNQPVVASGTVGGVLAGGETAGEDAFDGLAALDDGPTGTAESTGAVAVASEAPPPMPGTEGQSTRERAVDSSTLAADRNVHAGERGLDRRESAEVSNAAPGTTQVNSNAPGAQVRSAARSSTRAARWLDQAVRSSTGASHSGEATSPALEAQPATASTATPARASEALFRLAQASDNAPQRHGAVAAVAYVPLAPPVPATPSASEVPAPSAPALPAAVGEQVLNHVISSLRMQWKDGIGEARLQLRPDALGAVSVSLRVEAGAVTAVVRAESAQVQEWVVQNQETLRQQMEAAGLHLGELVVTPDDQGQPQQQAPQEQRRRRQSVPAPSATFEMLL